jgi:hypothetical protein
MLLLSWFRAGSMRSDLLGLCGCRVHRHLLIFVGAASIANALSQTRHEHRG